MNINERELLAKRLDLKLDINSFIPIPENLTCIKIDVGLSFTAPHAINWLKENNNLFVIGFEPLIENIDILKKTLEKKENFDIKKRFLIVSCALADSSGEKDIFVTGDKGLASLLPPKHYSIESMRTIKTETLDNFMNLVNLRNFKKIDYLKTDCQGFDLQVLKGGRNTLKNTVIVTCEADSNHYEGSANTSVMLENFFKQIGFEYINKIPVKSKLIRKLIAPIFNYIGPRSGSYKKFINKRHGTPLIGGSNLVAIDPTFVNSKFKNFVISGEVSAHQFN